MIEQNYFDSLILPKGLYEKIESDIATLLIDLNIHQYPIDPVQIALDLGYKLIPFNQMPKEARQILKLSDIDGISYYDPHKKTFIIYYRPDVMEERLRFTIGHEIGHIRMGHKGESELAKRIANYYAAYLLAPTPWIYRSRCDDYTDVASTFQISKTCALYCFERYERWCKLPYTKDYEEALMEFVS